MSVTLVASSRERKVFLPPQAKNFSAVRGFLRRTQNLLASLFPPLSEFEVRHSAGASRDTPGIFFLLPFPFPAGGRGRLPSDSSIFGSGLCCWGPPVRAGRMGGYSGRNTHKKV